MKKVISTILVGAMLLSMGTTALATTVEDLNTEEKFSVKGKFVERAEATVYSVDIQWDSMEFDYVADYKGEWNANDHVYENSATAYWDFKDNNDVTVTNHSNKDVTAVVDFTKTVEDEITGTFTYTANDTDTIDGVTLTSAVDVVYDDADKFVATLTVDGTLADTYADYTTIGEITVTLS